MVEITAEEQNKVKRKELKIVSEMSGTISNAPAFKLQGSQKKQRKKEYEKNFEEITFENFPDMEKEIVNLLDAKSPIQDKLKEKHTKTHTNQTNKD